MPGRKGALRQPDLVMERTGSADPASVSFIKSPPFSLLKEPKSKRSSGFSADYQATFDNYSGIDSVRNR
jgi:hypothetical protein